MLTLELLVGLLGALLLVLIILLILYSKGVKKEKLEAAQTANDDSSSLFDVDELFDVKGSNK